MAAGYESPSLWLSELAHHPIFSTHLQSRALGGVDEYAPPSPDASSISFTSRSRLDSLASLIIPDVDADASGHAHALLSRNSKKRLGCIARKTELLIAVGKEVRMMSLAGFKSRIEGESGESTSIPTGSAYASSSRAYKTLNIPAVTYEIQQLVISPSSRFLAVVGRSQVVVLELPRKGWDGLLSNRVDCSHDAIGTFYHSPSSSLIAKVDWHVWGESDATLLVLTADGLLREYNVLEDPEEPVQMVDFCSSGTFLPSSSSKTTSYGLTTPSRKSKRASTSKAMLAIRESSDPRHSKSKTPSFRDVDDDASTAVSFCFGKGEGDWSAFTLYCLMQNGDLYCVCPYLPKSARIPLEQLEVLAAFVSAKINYLTSQEASEQLTLSEKRTLDSRYAQQLKFVNALLNQQSSKSPDTDDTFYEDDELKYLNVHFPSHLRPIPLRQGPFLFQPAPRELDDSDESLACDIAYVHVNNDDKDGEPRGSLSSLLVSYTDGKVDVCLDSEAVEAQWGRSGEVPLELPALLVYETVDLFGSSDERPRGAIQIIQDPEYTDTLYLQHACGAHSISLQPLYNQFFPTSGSQQQLSAIVKQPVQASVAWLLRSSITPEDDEADLDASAVTFFGIYNEVYLGYGAIIVTSDGQVVPVQLSLRSTDEDTLLENTSSTNGHPPKLLAAADSSKAMTTGQGKLYTAFAESSAFTLPPLLAKNGPRPSTRFSAPASARSSKVVEGPKGTSIELTIEALKFVGQTVEKLDSSIKELIRAGNTVQDRIELHQRELPRQVNKLHDLDEKLNEKDELFDTEYSQRIESVKDVQKDLEKRADKILQKLIDSSQPELSAHERRWIEELGRVKDAVHGSATGDPGKSLQNRVARLKEQLDVLRPRLQGINTVEDVPEPNSARLGASQRASIEQSLSEEARLMAEARTKIDRITAKLARAN